MSAAVPKHVVKNLEYTSFFPEEQVKQVVEKIGIYERRFADDCTCSSDLCFAAAEKLIADNHIDRSEIDLLIFVSQTPDFRMPSTSTLLQERLGLPKTCMTFDVNQGCSAFLFGLSIAFSMVQIGGIRKALVLDGETSSKVYSSKDRRTAFIFGDAGTATLVERNSKFGNSYFSLNSDGSKGDYIMTKAGGFRYRSTVDTLKEKVVDEYGNIRSDEQGYMNGADVFNFVILEVPKDIKRTLANSGFTAEQMDYVVFHQANNFINSYIAKKMKLDVSKIPHCIEKFGNTASASVPLTIVSELKDKIIGEKKLLLSAFGVGMTWGTGILSMVDTKVSDIVEVENGKVVR